MIDPLNPWAGDEPPPVVDPPASPAGGPPVRPPADLPPAPGPRQTWSDERVPVPLPQELIPSDEDGG